MTLNHKFKVLQNTYELVSYIYKGWSFIFRFIFDSMWIIKGLFYSFYKEENVKNNQYFSRY